MASVSGYKRPTADVHPGGTSADAFRNHFDSLPGPAYMWQKRGRDFELIAYNHAAAKLPSGRISALGDNINAEMSRRLVSSFPDYFETLRRCVETAAVVVDERDFVYQLTQIGRRVKFTFVPVSSDIVVVHTEDVTERRRDEDQLRRSEARLAEAQKLASIGSWDLDLLSNELTWSSEIFRIFEIDPEKFDASYEAFLRTVHPDDRELVDKAYTDSVNDKKPYEIEHRLIMADGSIKYVIERGETYYGDDGAPLRSIGTVQDITERRKTQNKLDELRLRLEALTSVAFDGVVVSEEGLVRESTDLFARKLGYAHDELDGRPILSFVARPFRSFVAQKMTAQQADTFEFRALRKDGQTFPVQACVTTITLGTRPLQVSAFRDISARTRLEREVVTISDRERRRIGHDLHDSVCQLLFGASLSLKSASLRLDEESSSQSDAVKNALHVIENAIDQARHLSHLLAPMEYGSVGLGSALSKMISKIDESTAINCSSRCVYQEPIRDPDVAVQLYRIAQESVNNAVKHSQAKNIELNFYRDGDLLRLEVLDDGIGIPPSELEDCNGLGLSSLHYRAHMIDGNLEISRRESGGTGVVCVCPL